MSFKAQLVHSSTQLRIVLIWLGITNVKWIGCGILKPMQPHHTTPPHILWVQLTSYGVELSRTTYKERAMTTFWTKPRAHNNCLTRESTLLYPKVAAQIALFTSPLGYRIARTTANCNGCFVSHTMICLSGPHPFDLSICIHLSTYMSYVITS